MIRAFLVEILLRPFGEVFDGEREGAFPGIDPLFTGFLTLAERFGKSLDDFVPVEFVGVPFVLPVSAGQHFVTVLELSILALLVEVSLHVSNMGMVRTVAELLVQHLQEYGENCVSARATAGLAVDIEEDDIRVGGNSTFDIAEDRGVSNLVVEELNGSFRLAFVRVLFVIQQV